MDLIKKEVRTQSLLTGKQSGLIELSRWDGTLGGGL